MPSTHTAHRSRYEITNDILHILGKYPAIRRRHKTGIGYAARLTHEFTVRYLRGLANEGLLRISQDTGIYPYYEITSKGLRYLQLFEEIQEDLKPDIG